MDVKDLKRLLEAVKEADVGELTLETGDYKLSVKRGGEVVVAQPQSVQSAPATQPAQAQPQTPPQPQQDAPSPAPQAAPAPAASAQSETPASNLDEITAPIVGTFYAGPSPDAPDFVKVGSKVEAGAVLCIIEAMKLMNEIEAETAGTVKEILVNNEDPVEYGQVLFRIEPS